MYAENIWKGDILVAGAEEQKKIGRVRNICSKTQRAGGSRANTRTTCLYSMCRWNNLSWLESVKKSEHPLLPSMSLFWRAHLDASHWEAHAHDPAFQQPDLTDDDDEARDDFGEYFWELSYSSSSSNKGQTPRAERRVIPWYHSQTLILSGELRRHWMYCWKLTLKTVGMLMKTWICQGPWTGGTRFTIWIKKPPTRHTWSGGRLTKVQRQPPGPNTKRPEVWLSMSKSLKKTKKKRQWVVEKPKLDTADMDFENTMRRAQRKLKTALESSMPCKAFGIKKPRETCGHDSDNQNLRYTCILNAHESTSVKLLQFCRESLPGAVANTRTGRGRVMLVLDVTASKRHSCDIKVAALGFRALAVVDRGGNLESEMLTAEIDKLEDVCFDCDLADVSTWVTAFFWAGSDFISSCDVSGTWRVTESLGQGDRFFSRGGRGEYGNFVRLELSWLIHWWHKAFGEKRLSPRE